MKLYGFGNFDMFQIVFPLLLFLDFLNDYFTNYFLL